MKPTDFAYSLSSYLGKYLPGEVGASSNTIKSYRDTFSILLKYCAREKGIPTEKLTLDKLDKSLIEDFLLWIQTKRECSVSTRNQRLAAGGYTCLCNPSQGVIFYGRQSPKSVKVFPKQEKLPWRNKFIKYAVE